MENAEEVLQSLDSFSKLRPKNIPRELEEYLCFVARTGEPVFHWSIIKSLFREKLLHVLTEFHDSSPGLDLPPCPNVDPFNYDTMKNCLLERIDSFASAPFTVQRICELLTCPRKQYSRIDKYMRAIEKNILVVSTREPGNRDQESGDPLEAVLNGDGFDMHIEIEMDGNLAWKDSSIPAECPVRNDITYSITNESPNCIATSESATNCTNNLNKQSDTFVKHSSDANVTSDDNLKIEEEIQKEIIAEQSVSEVSIPFTDEKCQKTNAQENSSEETLEQKTVSNDLSISISTNLHQHQSSETFLSNNDTEENTDTSETDSNLTEDSVTSELQEAPAIVDENSLVISDIENSNDGVPFLNVQAPVETNEIPCVNDFQEVLKSDYPQINIIQNNIEDKPQQEDKIDSNMEKLFQIVCETVPETSDADKLVETVAKQLQNDVCQTEPIVKEPEEIALPEENVQIQENKQSQENVIVPLENTVPLVSEGEPEQMVADAVENNFIADLKPSEVIEQDQVESMDIPESAMECEEAPAISEPMDQ